jgi:hypothetical protein
MIKCYRLLNGAEIIGYLDREDDKIVVLTKAMAHILSPIESPAPGEESKLEFGIVPLSYLTEKDGRKLQYGCDITLQKSAVAFEYELHEHYIEMYTNAVAIIKTDKPKLIVPV